jgi:coenzyme PQQ biosynthesis protein PqqD
MPSFDEQNRPGLARGVRLQSDVKTGEPVLLYPEGVLYLSETAYDIVSRCNGEQTISSIVSALAQEYELEEQALRQDVLDCLKDLHQRKLVLF